MDKTVHSYKELISGFFMLLMDALLSHAFASGALGSTAILPGAKGDPEASGLIHH
ncbi:MAG: hypothetical protein RG741_01460 [Bacteroidales bacterium]|nr:hypothetical protein [Bacteroidales bacterium]